MSKGKFQSKSVIKRRAAPCPCLRSRDIHGNERAADDGDGARRRARGRRRRSHRIAYPSPSPPRHTVQYAARAQIARSKTAPSVTSRRICSAPPGAASSSRGAARVARVARHTRSKSEMRHSWPAMHDSPFKLHSGFHRFRRARPAAIGARLQLRKRGPCSSCSRSNDILDIHGSERAAALIDCGDGWRRRRRSRRREQLPAGVCG